MKKKLLYLIVALVAAFTMTLTVYGMTINAPVSASTTEEPVTTISEVYIPSETSEPEEEVIVLDNVVIERVEPTTLEEANKSLEDAMFRQNTAVAIYEGLLTLGYAENHPAVVMARCDIENTELDRTYYEEKQAELQEQENWRQRASEYPIATQAWLYMKYDLGFSDIVCAGIMGNLMAECGGCWTSDLDYNANSSSGYGMIQWLGGRKDQLFAKYGSNPTVQQQLEFVKDELYGTNGVTKQVTDEQLDKIINAETPEECAFAFATYFERCASQHRAPRRDYARRAYEYFVG